MQADGRALEFGTVGCIAGSDHPMVSYNDPSPVLKLNLKGLLKLLKVQNEIPTGVVLGFYNIMHGCRPAVAVMMLLMLLIFTWDRMILIMIPPCSHSYNGSHDGPNLRPEDGLR